MLNIILDLNSQILGFILIVFFLFFLFLSCIDLKSYIGLFSTGLLIIMIWIGIEKPSEAYLKKMNIPSEEAEKYNNLGFGFCYRDNYTGETCLNYLKYFENKIKEEQAEKEKVEKEKAEKEEIIKENIEKMKE